MKWWKCGDCGGTFQAEATTGDPGYEQPEKCGANASCMGSHFIPLNERRVRD